MACVSFDGDVDLAIIHSVYFTTIYENSFRVKLTIMCIAFPQGLSIQRLWRWLGYLRVLAELLHRFNVDPTGRSFRLQISSQAFNRKGLQKWKWKCALQFTNDYYTKDNPNNPVTPSPICSTNLCHYSPTTTLAQTNFDWCWYTHNQQTRFYSCHLRITCR